MDCSSAITESGSDLLVRCWIQPRASKEKIVGLHGDAVKIAITAPPVDGKANTAIIKFFSKCLKIPKASIQIKSGETGRNKVIKLTNYTAADFLTKYNLITK